MHSNIGTIFGLNVQKLFSFALLNIKKLKFHARRVIYDGVMAGEESRWQTVMNWRPIRTCSDTLLTMCAGHCSH